MGHNDHLDDISPELPPEAGESTRHGFEPNNEWLETASPEDRLEAMRQWFLTRYWDPANETPYCSQEGGYLFIYGGPYEAAEELYSRFEDLVPEELIQAAADDIESCGIHDWAPIHTDPDYDEDFEYDVPARDEPYVLFHQRIQDLDELITVETTTNTTPLLHQLVYSSIIAALEAYLAETISYWLEAEPEVLRRFVTNCEEFKKQNFKLADIFNQVDNLKNEVEKYLQGLVWHRLDKIIPLLASSFDIERPSIKDLMNHIVIRHDIVHRCGRTKEGIEVHISPEKLNELRKSTVIFVNNIESEIQQKYPDMDNFL